MGGLGAAEALEGTHRRETEGAKRRHELSRILWWELLDRFQTLSDLDWWTEREKSAETKRAHKAGPIDLCASRTSTGRTFGCRSAASSSTLPSFHPSILPCILRWVALNRAL